MHLSTTILSPSSRLFKKKIMMLKKSTSAALSGSIINKLRFVSDSKRNPVTRHGRRLVTLVYTVTFLSVCIMAPYKKKKQFAKS